MFEELLRLHYAHKRKEVEAQCRRWIADAARGQKRDPRLQQMAEAVLAEIGNIRYLLDADDTPNLEENAPLTP